MGSSYLLFLSPLNPHREPVSRVGSPDQTCGPVSSIPTKNVGPNNCPPSTNGFPGGKGSGFRAASPHLGPRLGFLLESCSPGHTAHFMQKATKKHNLTVNLTTFRLWCYACEKEVFLEQRLAAPLPGSSSTFSEQDSPPLSHPLKAVPIAVADEGESESEDDDLKPRGNGPHNRGS
ncbi:Ubiquitin carboxyl-terminal hydrolase 20 [Saguinus oedipus]|uniref:Ubiquitin carboxyl-terminal hydrolase 20 n=1 Tax=Saguinus oedipus TaxID=9490 RepID=A0ABQ9WFN9_SAGOE|nr:Ubiquitin carboxyl-terminal hydrolase 20 [Saguinus oedipus]